jgi:hypothetical protein
MRMRVRREKVERDFAADYIFADAMREATFLHAAMERQ